MKMTRKKWIIIAVVVALAAFLVWWFTKNKGEGIRTAAASDKDNLDAVIKAAFGNDTYADRYAAATRQVYQDCKTSESYRNHVESQAEKNGVTFAQQCAIEATYGKCWDANKGNWRDQAHKNYFYTVKDRVLSM